jgi:hypothetical protein
MPWLSSSSVTRRPTVDFTTVAMMSVATNEYTMTETAAMSWMISWLKPPP